MSSVCPTTSLQNKNKNVETVRVCRLQSSSLINCVNYFTTCIYRLRGRRGRDRMVDGYTTTCAISVYHHWSCEFKRDLLDTTLCDKVCQWLATGRWFSPDTPVSSTNNTDRHVDTEILLKVALNTTTPIVKCYLGITFISVDIQK